MPIFSIGFKTKAKRLARQLETKTLLLQGQLVINYDASSHEIWLIKARE